MAKSVDIRSFHLITDTVMGGVSQGTLTRAVVEGREAVRLRGAISLANKGGFIQMAADINRGGAVFDASALTGVEVVAFGNGETYNIHLRTSDIMRPWQSYRQSFVARSQWQTHRIPFSDFVPHRIDSPLNTSRLTRIGIVAIGRAFEADVSVASIGFF